MNFEYFFAKRITFQHQRAVSGLVVKLSIVSLALAVATMEISLSFVRGFEQEIRNKIVGFSAPAVITHIREKRLSRIEFTPIELNDSLQQALVELPNVRSVSPYIQLAGLFEASPENRDVVLLKGVDAHYDWDFLGTSIKEGRLLELEGDQEVREILISAKQSRRLQIGVGDQARLAFLKGTRAQLRPVEVVGIYETGMEEFDTHIMICDLRLLRRIWRWESNQVSGLEIQLDRVDPSRPWIWDGSRAPFFHRDSLSNLQRDSIHIVKVLPYDYKVNLATNLFSEVFDWLELQHQNVWVILILMIVVAVINMASVVLILIIERTRTVGVLKALGLSNWRLQRMFAINAAFLILIGMLAGNVLGLGLLALQDATGILKVNPEDYFINQVPVAWVWGRFVLVNLGAMLIWTLFMIIPTLIINRISPSRAIRFE